MKIDLHVHSKDGSDGAYTVEEIIAQATRRGIDVISLTDHDSIAVQAHACSLATAHGMRYLYGAELNVTFSHSRYRKGKQTSLDFLAYQIDIHHAPLCDKLRQLSEYRTQRALKVLANLNQALREEGRTELTEDDMQAIQDSVDGSFGRPHIANYLIEKSYVTTKQEAFDRYLVRCDVPKMPLLLEEAAELVHGAGGKLVLAHPNDPNGTSLVSFTSSIPEQQEIIATEMLEHIDGVECWHSRHDRDTSRAYLEFTQKNGLLATGGSDCHQQPVLLGSVKVPDWVVDQFELVG